MIFDQYLEPKRFNGREITGKELLTFVKVYAKMFGDAGGAGFPKAMTMLEATSDANNRNAYDLAISGYRATMNKSAGKMFYLSGGPGHNNTHSSTILCTNLHYILGPDASFCKEAVLLGIHNEAMTAALEKFSSIANMGVESAINAKRSVLSIMAHGSCPFYCYSYNFDIFREKLIADIEEEEARFFEINSYRNPFRNVEYYIIPMVIAVFSFITAKVVDWSCSTDFCEVCIMLKFGL